MGDKRIQLRKMEELSTKPHWPMVIKTFCVLTRVGLPIYTAIQPKAYGIMRLSDNAAPTVPHSATFTRLNMTLSSNSHFASPSFEREREFHHYREGIYRTLSSMADMNVRNGVIDEATGSVGFCEID
ncbi:hypothetical protein HDV63DRAFT_371841 [Trichoderma sp. SZMC 28014]